MSNLEEHTRREGARVIVEYLIEDDRTQEIIRHLRWDFDEDSDLQMVVDILKQRLADEASEYKSFTYEYGRAQRLLEEHDTLRGFLDWAIRYDGTRDQQVAYLTFLLLFSQVLEEHSIAFKAFTTFETPEDWMIRMHEAVESVCGEVGRFNIDRAIRRVEQNRKVLQKQVEEGRVNIN